MAEKSWNKLMTSLWLLSASLILMVAVSFAWMSISRKPTVQDIELSTSTLPGLYVAADVANHPGQWSTVLDLNSVHSTANIKLSPMMPDLQNRALAYPQFGKDGRVSALQGASMNVESTSTNSFYTVTFWLRCEQKDTTIHFAEAMEQAENVMGQGCYLRADSGSGVSGSALSASVRASFLVTVTNENEEPTGQTEIVTYEPNADLHQTGADSFSVTGYTPEPDDGNFGRVIAQADSTGGSGAFLTEDSTLVRLEGTDMAKVTMVIWMCASDEDCTGQAFNGSIVGNFQFRGERNQESEITPR